MRSVGRVHPFGLAADRPRTAAYSLSSIQPVPLQRGTFWVPQELSRKPGSTKCREPHPTATQHPSSAGQREAIGCRPGGQGVLMIRLLVPGRPGPWAHVLTARCVVRARAAACGLWPMDDGAHIEHEATATTITAIGQALAKLAKQQVNGLIARWQVRRIRCVRRIGRD